MNRFTRSITFRIDKNTNADLEQLLAEVLRNRPRSAKPSVLLRRLIREAAEKLRASQAPPSSKRSP